MDRHYWTSQKPDCNIQSARCIQICRVNWIDKCIRQTDIHTGCMFTVYQYATKKTSKCIGNYIENSGIHVEFPINELERLLYKCLHEIQYQYDRCGYRQEDGLVMKSPIGHTAADSFVAGLENGLLFEQIVKIISYRWHVYPNLL